MPAAPGMVEAAAHLGPDQAHIYGYRSTDERSYVDKGQNDKDIDT